MNRSRLGLIAFAVVVVVFLAGVFLGRSGRAEADREAAETALLLDIQTGRARVLEARVALYNVNFGEASRHFERAKPMFERARDRLNATNRQADAGVLDRVAALIAEAQRMTGALDQGANTKAAEALDALRDLTLPEVPAPSGQPEG